MKNAEANNEKKYCNYLIKSLNLTFLLYIASAQTLKKTDRKYKRIIVLAVVSVAIVAYVIPFNFGSVSQTQAQPSLYERLHERLDKGE